MTESHTSAS